MAWTAPKTWSVGETLTAANFNTHIRDNSLAVGPHLIARRTTDQSNATTTLANDDTLQFAVAANEVWLFHFTLRYEATTAADMKMSFSFPTGGAINIASLGADSGLTVGDPVSRFTTSDTPTPIFGGSGTGLARILPIEGLYIGGGNAGTVILRWAEGASDATPTKMLTHSTLWAVKLA